MHLRKLEKIVQFRNMKCTLELKVFQLTGPLVIHQVLVWHWWKIISRLMVQVPFGSCITGREMRLSSYK